MNNKTLFLAEVEKINDAKLKKVAKSIANKIPKYFWVIPASSSGKYHPACDLGDGGLVRHSIMVSRCAEDLVVSEMYIRDCEVNRDIARFAALFHDCMKNGPVKEDGTYSDHTEFEHPRFASDFIREQLEAAKIDPLKIEMICGAIYTHMGKWCTDKYGKGKALSKPRTDFEKLIHIADYVASRKYIGGLDEWKTEEVPND